MDPKTTEDRARVACRIYLALYDAGEAGANFVTGATHVPGYSFRESQDVVWSVMEALRTAGAILPPEGTLPRINTLPPEQRDRMAREMPGVGSYAERLRSDLAVYDRGGEVHAGAFIKTEAAIRTGYSEADPL